VPQIGQLVEQRQHVAAFRLAREAEQYIPGDPVLKKVEDGFLLAATIRTTPPGAAVYMKEYTDVDGHWEYLGQTPIDTARLPFAYLHWKFTKDGHDPVEGATMMIGSIAFTLEPVGSVPPDMVRVPAGTVQLGSRPPAKLDDFLMDKYEVTNRQFKKFVDGGGYRNAAYWKEPFVKNGRALSREEVVAGFRDKTDRPGPATWEAGGYPQGQDDFPVSGVSWYEAAAYAEFVGEALPTVYHWRRAAATEDLIYADILKLSNFAGKGAARVGSYPGLGPFGTYDMAGNVKEWCLNAVGDRRYILGGAWNEPEYMYLDEDAKSPFDRSADNGFRLVKYLAAGPLAATLRRPIKQLTLDVRGQKPVSDEAFGIYRSLYAYDRGLLDPKVESVDETSPYWRQERITFNAAYGHERVIAYLLLPKGVAPPYQTIIYFPHSGALVRPAIEHADVLLIDFLVKSGRALLFPVYKDTYERLTQPLAPGMNAYRDEVVLAAKDFGRSLDYLETRPDVDRNRLGFYGLSWGAGVGPIVSAIDHRVKVAVLVGGGCEYGVPPEIDPINFAPRVRIPVLMINGRYDFTAPLETCQEPVFRLLGSPSGAKKHLVFDAGHVPPWIPTFRETLNWFDRFLGPVK
jgi:formylglycine-generating enzyme required for sulfatase activity/pimeloyl-ACP methyl ester carboxylesterase